MSEYKIGAVDIEPAKEWKNPTTGKVIYYITVGLEGHDKPVSIGKIRPDALKAGDTVYGTIIETQYPVDKWKGEAPPQTPQNASGGDNKYLKDTSDLPKALVIELLKYYDVQSLYNSSKYTEMIQLAQSLNDDIMAIIQSNRGEIGKKEEPKETKSLTSSWQDQKNAKKAIPWTDEPIAGEEEQA